MTITSTLGSLKLAPATNNAADARTVTLTLPAGAPASYVDELDGTRHIARDGRLSLTVPGLWGRVLQARSP